MICRSSVPPTWRPPRGRHLLLLQNKNEDLNFDVLGREEIPRLQIKEKASNSQTRKKKTSQGQKTTKERDSFLKIVTQNSMFTVGCWAGTCWRCQPELSGRKPRRNQTTNRGHLILPSAPIVTPRPWGENNNRQEEK